MKNKIEALVKEKEIELKSDLNTFSHAIYEVDGSVYVNAKSEIFNGITYRIDSPSLNLCPSEDKDLEWYIDKIVDYYEFVLSYLELTQYQ
jgi:hypothetical protein